MTFIDDINTRITATDKQKPVCAAIYARDGGDIKSFMGIAQILEAREFISNHPNILLSGIFYDSNKDGETTHDRPKYLNMLKDIEDEMIELIIAKSKRYLNTNLYNTAILFRLLASKKIAVYCLDNHSLCSIDFYNMSKNLADMRHL